MNDTGGERTGATARHSGIVALVRQRGFMAIEALANHFDVTVQTIRRDLNLLSEEGRVLRYHGGAGLPSSIENIDYTARQVMHPAEKDRIARLVAAEIPAHASLFINIGTTTEAVARALAGHQDLQVITNNLNVASTLARSTGFKIVLTGGTVRNRDGGIVTSGKDWIDRVVAQVAAPVRWDLCMETMAALGVTALLELPPGGTLAGLKQRGDA